MSEKHSIVIEEYLLLLYQLRGWRAPQGGYPSTAPQEQCTDGTRYPAAHAAR